MDNSDINTAAAPDNEQSASPKSPRELVHHHARALALALKALNSGAEYQIVFSDDERWVCVTPAPRPAAPIYTGAGLYEVEMKNGTRPILWMERHPHKSKPGFFFIGQHRWKGLPEGNARGFRENQVRLVRKIDSDGRA